MSAFMRLLWRNWNSREVERQIILADLVEGAHNAALDDRPKAFNRICVDSPDDVMATAMVDHAMREPEAKAAIACVVVRAKQADLGRTVSRTNLPKFRERCSRS